MLYMGWLGFAALILGLSGAAHAATAESVPAAGNVSFVSGGVGADALERLEAREKEFNLKLVFTLSEGNYLADVGVRVADAAGKTVIEHVADGPIFMAKLPRGTYTVSATYDGRTQTRKIAVGERLQTAYLRWPAEPGRDITLPLQPREAAAIGTSFGAPGAGGPSPSASAASKSSAGVPFIAGGVGDNMQEQMEARQKNFNLKLVFTLVEGNYLADVDVAIKDAGGKTVLEHHVPGPFLLAELQPGTYGVTATYEGKTRSRKVRVGKSLNTEYFRWPSDPKADVTLTREPGAK